MKKKLVHPKPSEQKNRPIPPPQETRPDSNQLPNESGSVPPQGWSEPAWRCYNQPTESAEARLEKMLPVAEQRAPFADVTPGDLVKTALALLAAESKSTVNSAEVKARFPEALKMLSDAASFLRAQETASVRRLFGIPFKEILASNAKGKPQSEKLLPGITTPKGLIKCIRRFSKSQGRQLSPSEIAALERSNGRPMTTVEKKRLASDAYGKAEIEAGETLIEQKCIPPSTIRRIQEWRMSTRHAKRAVQKNFRKK